MSDSQGLISLIVDPECKCSGWDWWDKEMSTGSMDQMKKRKTGGGTEEKKDRVCPFAKTRLYAYARASLWLRPGNMPRR